LNALIYNNDSGQYVLIKFAPIKVNKDATCNRSTSYDYILIKYAPIKANTF